ncbi:MAG: winged helix-turn-helix domain-containing protein [Methanosarcinaceae archaeon]|nr:winged helix-turn-helix domain-containing protein [Methanosarcinaceae archaeon]MDD4497174.1 winged helix-turn-helix domain-containing protein [Methanosarcinaceae archaeon]
MEKELIDLLFLSRKRKDLLILLKDGDRDIDEIKNILPFKPTALLPQLKKLKDEELVLQEGKNYRLSIIGKILVEKMKPLLDLLDVIEENEEFWQERNLEEVPLPLLHRLNELKPYTLVEPNSNNIFDLPELFIENLSKSKHILSMLTYFHPQFPSILLENRDEDTEITLILTENLFKRIKKDFEKELSRFLVRGKRKLFVCDTNIKIAMITSTERFMLAGFFGQKNTFDQKNILSFEPTALRWAGDLILHYKKEAREITET